MSAAWAELYGTERLGAIRAFGTSMMVVATALGPGMMGLMIDEHVSINVIALLRVGYVLAGAGLASAGARRFARGAHLVTS